MSDLYLSITEVQDITGRSQGAAQRRALMSMGYAVKDRPDGSFWVPRAQFLEVAAPVSLPKKHKLNFGALKGGSHGKAA